MAGVHPQGPGTIIDLGQAAESRSVHLVAAGFPIRLRPVMVALDVLEKGAAESHVEELVTAADGEHRQIALQSSSQER
jgi:hypothetical protein